MPVPLALSLGGPWSSRSGKPLVPGLGRTGAPKCVTGATMGLFLFPLPSGSAPQAPPPSPAAQGHSSYLPGHLLIWHREAEGVRPWVQEVSGKHVVWGLALLRFPFQVNLLHLRGFAGACEADTDSEAPQSRVLSPVLRTVALLRGLAGSLHGDADVPWGPGPPASLLAGPGGTPLGMLQWKASAMGCREGFGEEGGNGRRRGWMASQSPQTSLGQRNLCLAAKQKGARGCSALVHSLQGTSAGPWASSVLLGWRWAPLTHGRHVLA